MNSAIPRIKVRILVVDDEKDITDLLVRHFRFIGYDIVGVNDAAAAIKMVEDENFNIVITDIMMPGMDGIELLKRIKQYNGAIQVIMITGYVTMFNILAAMRGGAETVFFKPIKDLEKMEETIRQCIARIQMWQKILKELGTIGKPGE